MTRCTRGQVCVLLAALCFAQWPTGAHASDAPKIVSRAEWNAKPPILSRMRNQQPDEIVIHHTGVKQQPQVSLEQKLRGLQSFSQGKKKWGDSPYHFYIGVSGRIGEARNIAYAGDTNTKYDVMNRIQVVVEGHFDKERPNEKQLASLRRLVSWLTSKYLIPSDKITGHGDHVSTDCPGKNLKTHLSGLRANVSKSPSETGGGP